MSDSTLLERLKQFNHAISVQELAKLLATSPDTIYRQTSAFKIPFFKVGDSLRFDPGAIAA